MSVHVVFWGDVLKAKCMAAFWQPGAVQPKARLVAHLEDWLGAWPPPEPGITVVGSPRREERGWDGLVRPVAGVATPDGTVLSVPPGLVDAVEAALGTHRNLDRLSPQLAAVLGRPAGRLGAGIFRWCAEPADFPDAGEWVARDDPRVPGWLKPFNGDVLIAWDSDGAYAAGVGRKIHDRYGHEISVGTEAAQRGKGLARRLVAQASRRILADGAVPTYLHDPANTASAKVAAAVGFPDEGWKILGFWGGDTP
jgi:GNAT superfamily N-acetyltransferase